MTIDLVAKYATEIDMMFLVHKNMISLCLYTKYVMAWGVVYTINDRY